MKASGSITGKVPDMAKATNKTDVSDVDPKAYLATLEPSARQTAGLELLEFFDRVTGLEARMWGPSIIGYGRYHYRYASGREGDYLATGFSPRKSAISIYILPGYLEMDDLLARLGSHKTGKSCLYIKRLGDIDMAVLEEIVLAGLARLRATYDTFDI